MEMAGLNFPHRGVSFYRSSLNQIEVLRGQEQVQDADG